MGHAKIELYTRTEKEWLSLGHFWVYLKSISCPYPFRRYGQERYEGSSYEVIVRHEERILKAEKIVWQDIDFFLLGTPKKLASGKLSFQVFSWKRTQEKI